LIAGDQYTLTFQGVASSPTSGDHTAFVDSVDIIATPLPAALPLVATGFGAMGLLGWRGKRKVAALVAAKAGALRD
jgi:hypothetical protein